MSRVDYFWEEDDRMAKRALISVSDKTGVVIFAQGLHQLGYDIISTGGTATLLKNAGIVVTEVAQVTGFPEMMAGRIKTLHPKIHGGLLGRRGIDDAAMTQQGIESIELLAVNLYPFVATVAKPECTLAQAIENIDIGGPAMLRAGAKNYTQVTVIVDSQDYAKILVQLQQGPVSIEQRYSLACKVFSHTAQYDGMIANYLNGGDHHGQRQLFPEQLHLSYEKKQSLRYGENPHQQAVFYSEPEVNENTLATAKQWQGKELSYNNIADADAALECAKTFPEGCACVIVKHANPCGVAVADNIHQAYENAYLTDPTSAFGGIIAFNGELDEQTARSIIERQFVEVIVAPKISPAAIDQLRKKNNIRVLETGPWGKAQPAWDFKRVVGGLLVQERDLGLVPYQDFKVVSRRKPTPQELVDLYFSYRVAKFVKSNAIVYAKNAMTIGIGAGQMSRVYSAKIASLKAAEEKLEVQGSVMASDAFFPFRDGIDAAAAAGISAVVQPGGSMRDAEVIAAIDEYGMAMVFTGMRHFRH